MVHGLYKVGTQKAKRGNVGVNENPTHFVKFHFMSP